MIHGIHPRAPRTCSEPGPSYSTVVFSELKANDGDAVSAHKVGVPAG